MLSEINVNCMVQQYGLFVTSFTDEHVNQTPNHNQQHLAIQSFTSKSNRPSQVWDSGVCLSKALWANLRVTRSSLLHPSASRNWGWNAIHPPEGRSRELFLHCLLMCSVTLKACGDIGPRAMQWLQLSEQKILQLVLIFLNLCWCPLFYRGLEDLNLPPKSRKEKSMWCDREDNDKILCSRKIKTSVLLKKWITTLISFEPSNPKTSLEISKVVTDVYSYNQLKAFPLHQPGFPGTQCHKDAVFPFQKKAQYFPICPFKSPGPLYICPWECAFCSTKDVYLATKSEGRLLNVNQW